MAGREFSPKSERIGAPGNVSRLQRQGKCPHCLPPLNGTPCVPSEQRRLVAKLDG